MGYVRDGDREYWEYPKLADAGVVPQLRAEIERLTAENQKLRAALEQIVVVCNDNEPESCHKGMALHFVRDVACATLRTVTGEGEKP